MLELPLVFPIVQSGRSASISLIIELKYVLNVSKIK